MNHICHLGYKSHKNNAVFFKQIFVTQRLGYFKSAHHILGYNSLIFRQQYDCSVFLVDTYDIITLIISVLCTFGILSNQTTVKLN